MRSVKDEAPPVEVKTQPEQIIIFQIAQLSDPLKNDIIALQQAISKDILNLPHVSIHVLFEEELPELPELIFRFEMVDDRIRELENKEQQSVDLFKLSNENCVWIFNCLKPTAAVECVSIKNAIKSRKDFKSGYKQNNGASVNTWLQFEYGLDSSARDKEGNFVHYLCDKEKVREKITSIIYNRFK